MYTTTLNGATTLETSGSKLLDFFAMIGGERYADPERYIQQFKEAYAEAPDLATKCLFYVRDIRGGLGERKIFRDLYCWLAQNKPETAKANMSMIHEYGRWDDILPLLDTRLKLDVISMIGRQLLADKVAMSENQPVTLLAKWLPSENATSTETKRYARLIMKCLGLSEKEYRKTLSSLRRKIGIIEDDLRQKKYDFDYEAVPGRAAMKYREAFWRNDQDRYSEYLAKVNNGEAKMNTATLQPYDIVSKINPYHSLSSNEAYQLDTAWNALPDWTTGENALVMLDGSGSMYGKPWEIGASLAIYFAERNRGPFHNKFMTFSMHPRLVEIEGSDIEQKVQYVYQYDECANTDISKAFQLIFDSARLLNAKQEDLPQKLYIISDMEFDCCVKGTTNFQHWKDMFEAAGYKLPQIVFWNVDSKTNQCPVTAIENNTILVSGSSASTFSMVVTGDVNPYNYMVSVLSSERYAAIHAKED